MSAGAVPLPARMRPLRGDLSVAACGRAADGSPRWTLHDPASGRFLALGWLEFEMLRRWALGTPGAVAARVAAETTLRPTPARVAAFAERLSEAELLVAAGAEGTARLLRRHAATGHGFAAAAMHGYLFLRLPLVRPDAFYAAAAPRLGWIGSRGFLGLTLLAGLLGLFLVLRQWDAFLSGFPHLATGQGIAVGALSVVALKLLHELGHGLVARAHGCRVRSAGVALMVFFPVLYTDLTEAWRLPDRRARLLIGAAGMATEIGVACWALLLWSVLPDGPARSVAFAWAVTAPALTLLVNLNPLMRFDGYFLLSDALRQPNLQEAAFALGRWRLRRAVLGLDDPPPLDIAPRRRALLIAYAWLAWWWRTVLFLGIAAAVYHIPFKALGILLAAVELGWFLLRPVAAELAAWRRALSRTPSMTRLLIPGALLGLLLVAVATPWRGGVHADGMLLPEQRAVLFAAEGAQVAEIAAAPGARVAAGDLLLRLASPALDHQVGLARLRIAALARQAEALAMQPGGAGRAEVLAFEMAAARAELAGAEAARAALALHAPFDGLVTEMAEPLRPGDWVRRGEALVVLAEPAALVAEGYVAEGDLWRFGVGAAAVLRPRNPDLPAVAARVEAVDLAATRELAEPALASPHGGPIAARAAEGGVLLPAGAVYRVRLRPLAEVPARRGELVTLRIEGAAESLLGRAWRAVLGVLLRESGF